MTPGLGIVYYIRSVIWPGLIVMNEPWIARTNWVRVIYGGWTNKWESFSWRKKNKGLPLSFPHDGDFGKRIALITCVYMDGREMNVCLQMNPYSCTCSYIFMDFLHEVKYMKEIFSTNKAHTCMTDEPGKMLHGYVRSCCVRCVLLPSSAVHILFIPRWIIMSCPSGDE